jgi:hypothetical protein
MGVVVVNNEDGTVVIMRLYYFEGSDAPTLRSLEGVVTGVGYVPASRPGPWALKKAIQHLIDRISGFHVDRFTLGAKSGPRGHDAGWTIGRQARRDGVEYINDNCPEENDRNQQWLWIQENIEANSGSPIAGWPECKAQRLAENKTKGSQSAAVLETFFPLNTKDIHPVWQQLLPLFFPLLPEYGLMMLGVPEIGKNTGIRHHRHGNGQILVQSSPIVSYGIPWMAAGQAVR